jgi:hypothetical protein
MTADQGAWAHPALLDICRALRHCSNMEPRGYLGPCPTRSYMKEKSQWCENCRANDALRLLDHLLEVVSNHGHCQCAECVSVKEHVKIGAAFQKKVDRETVEFEAEEARKKGKI